MVLDLRKRLNSIVREIMIMMCDGIILKTFTAICVKLEFKREMFGLLNRLTAVKRYVKTDIFVVDLIVINR